jgi:hypothetical protein
MRTMTRLAPLAAILTIALITLTAATAAAQTCLDAVVGLPFKHIAVMTLRSLDWMFGA